MPQSSCVPTIYLTSCLSAALAAFILLAAPAGYAADARSQDSHSSYRHPTDTAPLGAPGIAVTPPKSVDPRARLRAGHEIAAMDAIQSALDTVADGTTFVWHHRSGRLSAIIRPTASFRSSSGRVCRHIQLLLNTGRLSRKSEGVACRLQSRIWSLEG